jgi:hypothetical protein
MPAFSWITNTQAIAALAGRLVNSSFWTNAELQLYLNDALRTYNALTETWRQEFIFTAQGAGWNNLGTMSGSPRLRTVTDANLYTLMQYMLLEPPSGAGTWTGTSQFDLASFQFALQKRRDEMIQATCCNMVNLSPLATTPGTRRNQLADTILEPHRIRFLGVMLSTTGTAASGSNALTLVLATGAAAGQIVTGAGIPVGTYVQSIIGLVAILSQQTTAALSATAVQFSQPVTLTREDTQAFQYFEPSYLQTIALPMSWSVASEPPLAFDVDNAPNVPGTYDVLALQSGPTFAPPAATLLGVPDDWSWVLRTGALATLLSDESERTDAPRAQYYAQRYADGLKMMRASNWLLQANINGIPCDTPSLFEMDSYSPEWQASAVWPSIVNAGMDLIAATPADSETVSVTLVGNQPIPASGGDFIQVSRDAFDQVLNYAQFLASQKQGGQEFQRSMELEKQFLGMVKEQNKRIEKLGIFTDVLYSQGRREQELVPR